MLSFIIAKTIMKTNEIDLETFFKPTMLEMIRLQFYTNEIPYLPNVWPSMKVILKIMFEMYDLLKFSSNLKKFSS